MRTMLSVLLLAAMAAPDEKSDLRAAAGKLREQSSFRWTWTPKSEVRDRFIPGPMVGVKSPRGFVVLRPAEGEQGLEAVLKGEKIVFKAGDGWAAAGSADEDARVRRIQQPRDPAAEIEHLVDYSIGLRHEGDGLYSGGMNEDGVKLILVRGGPPGKDLEVEGAKGSFKVWLKAGLPARYEYSLEASIAFAARAIEVKRTVTVEISEVGEAKIDVPPEAREKLQ